MPELKISFLPLQLWMFNLKIDYLISYISRGVDFLAPVYHVIV